MDFQFWGDHGGLSPALILEECIQQTAGRSSTSLPTRGGGRACVFGVLLLLLMYLLLHFRRTCSGHQGRSAECKLCVQQLWPLTPLTRTVGYRDHWPFQHWTSASELAWSVAGTL